MASQARAADESRAVMMREMMPRDANSDGNVFGGRILCLIDEVAGIAAKRHNRGQCVTAGLHTMSFEAAAHITDMLHLTATVVHVGRTSMAVLVLVEAEDRGTGARRLVTRAHLTFVGIGSDGRPAEVPRLAVRTADEKRLWEEAAALRKR